MILSEVFEIGVTACAGALQWLVPFMNAAKTVYSQISIDNKSHGIADNRLLF